MLVVGIDENGFGPRLGPLVVTASLVVVKDVGHLLQSSFKESKKICSSGRMEECERIALSFHRLIYGSTPSSASKYLSDIVYSQEGDCSSPLPHCLPDFPLPCWTSESDLTEDRAQTFLKEIYVDLLEIRSIVICPGRFNEKLGTFSSKHHLEYALFEELIMYFTKQYQKEKVLFLCGRIGSTKDYSPFFNRFPLILGSPQREGETWYLLPDDSEVRFITDGDEKYFPIALSSVVGKYIRELFIEQMNRYFRSYLPYLPYCSGYINPVTKRFIEETKNFREEMGIPDRCFIRER